MKNNLTFFAVCLVLVLVISLSMHWLAGLVMVCIVFALLKPKPSAIKSFIIGFSAVFLVWAGMALFLSAANDHLLAGQIGDLFGQISPMLLIIFTGIIGGLAGGLLASTASVVFRRK